MNYGIYNYFLNGKPTGISENFNVEILPDGSIVTISDRNTSIYGTKIYLNSEQTGKKFKRFDIQITNENNAATADVHAFYEFSGDEFRFIRRVNNRTIDDEIFKLPADCVVFPLMRVFQGKTILQVAENAKLTTVLVPSIENPNDAENLLKPTFDKRRAEFVGREFIGFNQEISVTFEADEYKYFSKHYDENSRFWIADDGLLVAYRFAQSADKIWEVFLTTDEHK